MTKRWFTHDTPVTCYLRGGNSYIVWADSPLLEGAHAIETVEPDQWIDIDAYPQLEPYCITDEEYALRRLTGQL